MKKTAPLQVGEEITIDGRVWFCVEVVRYQCLLYSKLDNSNLMKRMIYKEFL